MTDAKPIHMMQENLPKHLNLGKSYNKKAAESFRSPIGNHSLLLFLLSPDHGSGLQFLYFWRAQ